MTTLNRRIVVGVDGSTSSRGALRWAAAQAALASAELEVVIGWSYPMSYGFPVIADVDWAADARTTVEAELTDVLGDQQVTVRVLEGHPARVLLDASRDADLLVVGSRGHGGFTGLLLGSVSEYVVTHASCPVVVVREPRQRLETDAVVGEQVAAR